MPKFPKYKRKNGQNILFFTSQQIRIKNGYVFLTNKMHRSGFRKIKTDLSKIKGVRIVPYGDRYNIELIYNYKPNNLHLNKKRILGNDLGLVNIISKSNNCDYTPFIIKGGVLKSINQFYNK